MSGQNYHHIGSLLPEVGKKPQFAQLYIYDTENEIDNRINTLLKHEMKTEIDHEILHELSKMLEQHNNLVKSLEWRGIDTKHNQNLHFVYDSLIVEQEMVVDTIYQQFQKLQA
ncbi:hypothetical protein AB3S75_019393 [Citrus x aurantiifolia]